jgi:hypothetical protein
MTRTITAAPAPNATSAIPETPCPRCKKPLIDPKGLGWCKACGFCRSLEDTEKKSIMDVKQAPSEKSAPAAAKSPAIPGVAPRASSKWIVVMLTGIVLIAGATYAGSRVLQLTPLERAVLTSLQIGIGVLVMFIGQFIGLLRIAAEESSLHFWDALFPFRLYGLIFKRLPRAAFTVYLGSWGFTAIVTAAVFIGGLQHWFNYLPGNQKNRAPQVQKTRMPH